MTPSPSPWQPLTYFVSRGHLYKKLYWGVVEELDSSKLMVPLVCGSEGTENGLSRLKSVTKGALELR